MCPRSTASSFSSAATVLSLKVSADGDGCINEDINGEKYDFYAMVAPNSISAIEKTSERIGLTQMGRGSGNEGLKEIMMAAQTTTERMGLVGREEESDEDNNHLKLLEKRCTTDLSRSQCAKGGQWCAKRRSLEEILKSSCRVKIGGPRSSRAPRKKGSVWDKHCTKAIPQMKRQI
ncbi:hypothetical protein Ancab_010528 [Ancistrocladus abbreviatus]